MKIIELGNYIAPAYAGMLLAEQGHTVHKWVKGNSDPIFRLKRGRELWDWINFKKHVIDGMHPAKDLESEYFAPGDAVIDNFKPETLARWGIDPKQFALDRGIVWVSIRSEVGQVSFDLLAQCRSILDFSPYIPFYIGDTVAGLFAAYKIAAARNPGHYPIGQASCLQKLVEGELILDEPRRGTSVPWETDYHVYDPIRRQATIEYRGETFTETVKNRTWKLQHLWHENGRIVI